MSSATCSQYIPDYVSPPGETLLEMLEERGMTQTELAERTGRPKKTISEIINGKAAIIPETALQLERVLGVPANFWNSREQNYRDALARQQEQARLMQQIEWLNQIPVQPMVKRGWIESSKDKVQQLQIVLNFFGVVSPEQWQAYWGSKKALAFRKSTVFESHEAAMAAWLRRGEIEAQRISCAPYDTVRFKRVLDQIRALTVEPPQVFQPKLVRFCASAGVAVVLVPELPKTSVSGVARWLTPTKALVQLSLRYKSDDHLWFTFFHEARHVLQERKRDIFLEGMTYDPNDSMEQDANTFAANTLIPVAALKQFLSVGQFTAVAIRQFAMQIGIAPGIVVGRLQHDGLLLHTHCNDLKLRLEWT
jgi:HTH-type transcriptional regulator / antitoxin HigA